MHTGTQSITIQIEAEVIGHFAKCDYGVPGSPAWDELEQVVRPNTITIAGQDYTRPQLVERFGANGADALLALIVEAAEAADADDWQEWA